ncbi:MAG: SGNH/GDSL hydrolase family protein [Candidatus Binatia bacterium]|nr:SGNH/GDSL hydrolase family protein [Candidatus Binatia bacterium]
MRGGFLGVSTCFTLSGFLIASLLLAGCSPSAWRYSPWLRSRIVESVRVDRLNGLVREQVGLRSGVHVLDLGGFVASWPGGEFDLALRRDRVHFSEEGSACVAQERLRPQVLQLSPAP